MPQRVATTADLCTVAAMYRPDPIRVISYTALAVAACAAVFQYASPPRTVVRTSSEQAEPRSEKTAPEARVEAQTMAAADSSAPPPTHSYPSDAASTMPPITGHSPVVVTTPPTFRPTPATSVTPQAISTASSSTAPEVVVVGDSLTVSTEAKLRDLIEPTGLPLRVDARSGRPTREGIGVLRGMDPKEGAIVVVALGTNDSNSFTKYSSYIDETMAIVGDASRVVWLTVNRPKGLGEINRALYAATGRYGNLRVADWLKVQQAHPEYLADDEVHFNNKGTTARAAFIFNAALT